MPNESYAQLVERRRLEKENTYSGAVRARVGEIADSLNPFKSSTAKTVGGRGKTIDTAVEKATNGTDGTNSEPGNSGSSTGQ